MVAPGFSHVESLGCVSAVVEPVTAKPLESLAASLSRNSESVTATATLINDLSSSVQSLHLYVRRLLSQDNTQQLIVIADQFEEVFTLCENPIERKAFIDNLLYAGFEAIAPPVPLFQRQEYLACRKNLHPVKPLIMS